MPDAVADTRVAIVLSRDAEVGAACADEVATTRPDLTVVLIGPGEPTRDVVHRPVARHDPERVVAEVRAVRDTLGPVGVLVSVSRHPVPGLDDALAPSPAEVLAEEVVAVQAAVDAVSSDLAAGGDGRVVLVGAAADLTGSGAGAAQAAAMWGLVGVMRALARSLGSSGVTVNLVRTGLLDRPASAAVADQEAFAASVRAVVADTPLKRAGSIDEVAAAVGYLTSAEASFLSGVVLPVDGGLTMGHTGA